MLNTLRAAHASSNWPVFLPLIAADCLHSVDTSMHRHRASIAQSPQIVQRQPRMYAFHMLIARLCERSARKVFGFVAKGHVYVNLTVHGGIFGRVCAAANSYFSVVVFVHSCNVNAAAN